MYFFKENYTFPSSALKTLNEYSFYRQYHRTSIRAAKYPQGIYSSYENFNNSPREISLFQELNSFYEPIIKKIMIRFNLESRCRYKWNFWFQIYNNITGGHPPHAHFDGKEVCSFIHFAEVNEDDPCSLWHQAEDKIEFLKEKTGDMIFFPPWVIHSTKDPFLAKNRIVVAGNIDFLSYSDPYMKLEVVGSNPTTWAVS